MNEENENQEVQTTEELPIWLKVILFPFWLVWWIIKAFFKFTWKEIIVKNFKQTMLYKIFFQDR